jgi:hypothetical protein
MPAFGPFWDIQVAPERYEVDTLARVYASAHERPPLLWLFAASRN